MMCGRDTVDERSLPYTWSGACEIVSTSSKITSVSLLRSKDRSLVRDSHVTTSVAVFNVLNVF